jgi:hypothetical protein
MAACPVSTTPLSLRRRPIMLTQRRIEANRRNAAHSTGPRTPAGKARVARNPIKHGFFAAQEKWTPGQHRDFAETLAGLRDDFKPQSEFEDRCIVTMARSYIRMAAMLHYENVAALEYHQQRDREMNQRIATAKLAEAAHLRAQRETLRRAGLWQPMLPGPREAKAIIRYSGSLDRTIRQAYRELQVAKNMRNGGFSALRKTQKQTPYPAAPRSGPAAPAAPPLPIRPDMNVQKQTHFEAAPSTDENAKANPLSSMFMGNRHERRRAKALAKRRT